MREPNEKSKRYRKFVVSEISLDCIREGNCCRTFGGSDGPKITREEKHAIIDVLNKKGMYGLVKKMKNRTNVPTVGKKALAMRCILQKGDNCSVHDIKPEVCREYPLFFSRKGDKVILDVDIACNNVDFRKFNNKLKEKFNEKFNNDLEINLYNSIEKRARTYLND